MILSNGYTCDGGNRTLKWSQFCDGIIDCYDRFDEEGHFCKLCINNIYSCSSKDDIRCDLACKMLDYVPCQTIQDRRACYYIQKNHVDNSIFRLWNEYKFYIVITIAVLLVLFGILILIKYFIRSHRKSIVKLSNHTIEKDTLSSHIYEQYYEPPPYETLQKKYPLTEIYYEHVV